MPRDIKFCSGHPNEERADYFAPFIDILKVNVREAAAQERVVQKNKQLRIALLADRIETEEDLILASRLGYDYYQGHYFEAASLKTNRVLASQANWTVLSPPQHQSFRARPRRQTLREVAKAADDRESVCTRCCSI
jgi:EAL domain-containing protein (putative c-di-GMP-specific phosphodiesterase class I)